ncbi:MAG: hypothetical protein LM587_01490 [Candidatus Aenigmarchaeota archaeon]|nr:hypothetical protein [Candidatus Aenigmarchaeota archaeon]
MKSKIEIYNDNVEKLILIFVGLIVGAILLLKAYQIYLYNLIGNAMCNGMNALDGTIYRKTIDDREVFILRCRYVVPPRTIEIKEEVIGWLKQ